ncbi:MAG: ROK family glucokinase [Suipraeoptans sp.]
MSYCYGVDIGGTTVKMGLFESDGTLLEKWEIKSRVENEGKEILPDVAKSIKENMKNKGMDLNELDGIGVGIPGPVNSDGVVPKTANLGWGKKDVKSEMTALIPTKIEVANDANVAALGEMFSGGGRGYKNLLVITLGTGVGGGIIINGQALVGEHGSGGEIGHITVNHLETEVCGCGRKGCLEQYASATGITRLAKIKVESDKRETVLDTSNMSAKAVFDAMKEGDIVAAEIAEEFFECLGSAISSISVIIDPAIVVIGGGVSRAGEVLLEGVEKHFKEVSFFANKDTKFALAELGNDAGIYGCAKLIIS